MNCRAPVVCLVTVPVSCLDTAAVPGGRNPSGYPPRARPLVLGHRFCLVLGHSSRDGKGAGEQICGERDERGEFHVVHVRSDMQRADFLTKPLPKETFCAHRDFVMNIR